MFTYHREQILEAMEENSIAVCYAGEELHANEDDYYSFIVNSQFYWMTGLSRAGMILMLTRVNGEKKATLFIDPYDPTTERWTGKMPTKEQVREISGVEDVRYTGEFDTALDRLMARRDMKHVYFDVHKNARKDIPTFNEVKAAEFLKDYPSMQLHDLHAVAAKFRIIKHEGEIERIRKAVDITRQGLENVMANLRPGKTEYQVQADFEYKCRYLGADYPMAFTTIAGAGPNGCMMHYVENDRELQDGELILLDLGCQYKNYCSDITRTYPANGKFTPRQREYYELVLKANKAAAAAAKPGVTLKELNGIVQKVLGEGLVAMGKIEKAEDVGTYYMHGCSHSMGVDVHDINLNAEAALAPGWVITDEPGLYIDEEAIGIRIEDDLLITEDGCEVLSRDVIREADEIEAFMASHGDHSAK